MTESTESLLCAESQRGGRAPKCAVLYMSRGKTCVLEVVTCDHPVYTSPNTCFVAHFGSYEFDRKSAK